MPRVPSRELRNHIAEVLRQVADGARVTVTVNGAAVAEISPVRETRPAFISKRDLIALLAHRQADPACVTTWRRSLARRLTNVTPPGDGSLARATRDLEPNYLDVKVSWDDRGTDPWESPVGPTAAHRRTPRSTRA